MIPETSFAMFIDWSVTSFRRLHMARPRMGTSISWRWEKRIWLSSGRQSRDTRWRADLPSTVKYIPTWFPGAQFQRDAKVWRGVTAAAKNRPFAVVKKNKAAGQIEQPSFVSSLLDDNEVNRGGDAEEDVIRDVAGTLFGGGSDTIAGTLLIFFLAMTLYPEVQAKAQAEIDRVIGDRLPSVKDKESTPYLNALVKETLRWHPIGPNGVPHRLLQDDIYNGYLIPAGTIITVNVWGILHDEAHFPDPFTFNPDRFLPNADPAPKDGTIDPWTVAFGYGRRICPGIHVAENGLWLAVATVLASFDIRNRVDPATGAATAQEPPRFVGGNMSFPEPFICDVKPRSKESAERVREGVKDMHV